MEKTYNQPYDGFIIKRYQEFRINNPLLEHEKIKAILKLMFNLTPEGFEHYIGACFQKGGYTVRVSGGLEDKGIDLHCEKKERYIAVQCKKHESNYVSAKDISHFLYCIKDYKARFGSNFRALFITTTWATRDAKENALKEGVVLWDYKNIVDFYKILPLEEFRKKHMTHVEWFRNVPIDKILDSKFSLKQ